MKKIGNTVTVGSGGASSIDFDLTGVTGYTDLLIKLSCRTDSTGAPAVYMKLNGVTTNMSTRGLEGAGSGTPTSGTGTTPSIGVSNTGSQTASVFSSIEVYIPNYTSSSQKFISDDSVRENNATSGIDFLSAGLWTGTSAINTITLRVYGGSANLVQYSTFYLYGINNS